MTDATNKAVVTAASAYGEQLLEIAGPERFTLDQTGTLMLTRGEDRQIVAAFAPGRWSAVRIEPAATVVALTDEQLLAEVAARGLVPTPADAGETPPP